LLRVHASLELRSFLLDATFPDSFRLFSASTIRFQRVDNDKKRSKSMIGVLGRYAYSSFQPSCNAPGTVIPGSPSDPLPEKETLPEGLWTAEQAAKYVSVHVDTLRKWVRLGKFPRIPLPGLGSDFRFSRELIDEWAKRRALGT
jgi:excisionase family DNA binding protein